MAKACSLLLVVLFLSSCRGSHGPSQDKTLTPSTKAKLIEINLAYLNFCASNARSPKNLDELAPFFATSVFPESSRKLQEDCLAELRKGEFVVIWQQAGAMAAERGTDIVTAHEQRTSVNGGFVVFADGRVEWMTPEALAQMPRHIETIRPEPKLELKLPDRETMKSELEKAIRNVGNETSKEDLIRLQGLWEIVSIEKSELALGGPAKIGDPCLIVGDKLTFKHKGWEATARIQLDASKEPKWIDTVLMEGEGEGVKGIYSLAGDKFTICNYLPGTTRPSDFDSKSSRGARMTIVIKRVSPKE